ncbi:MAG: CBS domain-containing protein [Clostridia bacterium]|nr:CBS domain-containing protein [Clostridia bacterium]MDD4797946.1 CBS domain-containing protein [Clostridia bacterium]
MRVAFFLLPKSETVYLVENQTVRQGLEKLRHHGYTAVPLLDTDGRYVGTLTTADFLWYLKEQHNLDLVKAEKTFLTDVPREHHKDAVSVNCEIQDLFIKAMEQNFIPVVDDYDTYIGIVRRRDIMEYFRGQVPAEFK